MCAQEGHVVNVGELLCGEGLQGREREQHSHGDSDAATTPDALPVRAEQATGDDPAGQENVVEPEVRLCKEDVGNVN